MTHTDLLQAIAEHLSEFSATPAEHDRWYLTHPDGATIILFGDPFTWERSKRVEISGSYAQLNGSHFGPLLSSTPRITCARSRGPEAIAKDISSRFLPKYLPLYEASVRRYEDQLGQEILRDSILAQLGTILGVEPDQSGREPSLYHYSDHGDTTIRETNGTVKMEIRSLSVAKALEIAQVLVS